MSRPELRTLIDKAVASLNPTSYEDLKKIAEHGTTSILECTRDEHGQAEALANVLNRCVSARQDPQLTLLAANLFASAHDERPVSGIIRRFFCENTPEIQMEAAFDPHNHPLVRAQLANMIAEPGNDLTFLALAGNSFAELPDKLKVAYAIAKQIAEKQPFDIAYCISQNPTNKPFFTSAILEVLLGKLENTPADDLIQHGNFLSRQPNENTLLTKIIDVFARKGQLGAARSKIEIAPEFQGRLNDRIRAEKKIATDPNSTKRAQLEATRAIRYLSNDREGVELDFEVRSGTKSVSPLAFWFSRRPEVEACKQHVLTDAAIARLTL